MHYVNCTGEQDKNCSIIGSSFYPEIFLVFSILIAFIGVILNVLSLYIHTNMRSLSLSLIILLYFYA